MEFSNLRLQIHLYRYHPDGRDRKTTKQREGWTSHNYETLVGQTVLLSRTETDRNVQHRLEESKLGPKLVFDLRYRMALKTENSKDH